MIDTLYYKDEQFETLNFGGTSGVFIVNKDSKKLLKFTGYNQLEDSNFSEYFYDGVIHAFNDYVYIYLKIENGIIIGEL